MALLNPSTRHTDSTHIPWIAFKVRVELADDTAEAQQAVALALDVLVARVNASMLNKPDMHFTPEQRWARRSETELAGEGTMRLYTTGTLRRWLTGPMRAVARGGANVRAVHFTAQYTGRSYWNPSID